MPLDPRIHQALTSAEPLTRLRLLVRELQGQGLDQSANLALFDQARQQLRQEGKDKEEDVLLEIMDFLVGWCSPHMSLVPKEKA